MIEINSLYKRYGPVQALNGVTLNIPLGQVTGLIGPNGCGKTTLIKSILGLVHPDRGEITVSGQKIARDESYRQMIGYMPQNPEFPSALKVFEIFDLMEDLRGTKSQMRERLVAEFSLEKLLQRPFGVLSGGTKQKVAAISSLMFDTPILILDEPSVGLDPQSSVKLKALVKKRAESGGLVLLVSHIMSEMELLCDAMIFLLDGEVRFQGSVSELKAQSSPPTKDLETSVANFLEKQYAE